MSGPTAIIDNNAVQPSGSTNDLAGLTGSVLDFRDDDENLTSVTRDSDGRATSYIATVDDGAGEVVVALSDSDDPAATEITKTYTYYKDGKKIVLRQVDLYRRDPESGKPEITGSSIEEMELDGQKYGAKAGKALSPFLTQAFLGKDIGALEKITVGSVTKVLLGGLGEISGGALHHSFLEPDTNGSVIAQLAENIVEDLPFELIATIEGSAISAATALLSAELFNDPFSDDVAGKIYQTLWLDGVTSGLTATSNILTKELLGLMNVDKDALSLFDAGPPSFIKNPLGFAMTTLADKLLDEISAIETTEGQIASSITEFALKLLPITKFLGPLSPLADTIIGWAIGKLFDELFGEDDLYWLITAYDAETDRIILKDDRIDSGDVPQDVKDALEALANRYVDSLNKIIESVDAGDHNLADLRTQYKFFGYEDESIQLTDLIGYWNNQSTAEFASGNIFYDAFFDTVSKIDFDDGDFVMKRALEAVQGKDFSQVFQNAKYKWLESFLTDLDEAGTGYFDFDLRFDYRSEHAGKIPAALKYQDGLYLSVDSFSWNYRQFFKHQESKLQRFSNEAERKEFFDYFAPFYETVDIDTPTASRLKPASSVAEAIGHLGTGPKVLSPAELLQELFSTLQIAEEFSSYLEDPEPYNAILAVAPDSPAAAGIVTMLMFAQEMGLNDPVRVRGSAEDNRFVTADSSDWIDAGDGDDLVITYGSSDVVQGGIGRDQIDGGNGADRLFGDLDTNYWTRMDLIASASGRMDDSLTGGGGDDLIDGGLGNDTAVFSGNIDDYIFRASPSSDWNVIDARPDQRDGSDSLSNIDVLQFKDATASIGNAGHNWIETHHDWQNVDGWHYMLGGAGNDSFYLDLTDKIGRAHFEILDFEDVDKVLFPSGWRHQDDPAASRQIGTYQFHRDGAYFVVSWTGYANYGDLRILTDENPVDRILAGDQVMAGEGRYLPPGPIQERRESHISKLNKDYASDMVGREAEVLKLDNWLQIQPGDLTVEKYQIWYDASDISVAVNGIELARGVGHDVADITTVSVAVPETASDATFHLRIGTDREWSDWQSVNVTAKGPEYFGRELIGTDAAERILGGDGEDYIVGNGGNDTLYGQYYNDTVHGLDGDDALLGGPGNDQMHGGTGNDVLKGDLGDDELYGGADDDRLGGWHGDDVLVGGSGNDHLDGSKGGDSLFGDSGVDYLLGGPGNDLVYGGDDNDIVRGEGDDDRLFGGEGDDRVLGEKGNDSLFGGAGHDSMDGGPDEGNDWALGGAGNDYMLGRNGQDALFGAEGDDKIFGGNGDDLLSGGQGADHADGGDGDDHLIGGLGQDTLRGRGGDDSLTGGAGDDALVADQGDDVVEGNSGNDRLWGGDGADQVFGDGGDDVLNGGLGDDQLFGGADRDNISGWDGEDVIYGGTGDDWLVGHKGDDRIFGGADNDILRGHEGSDRLSGGDGDDGIAGYSGDDFITGDAGNDTVWSGEGADTISFRIGDGRDVIQDFDVTEDLVRFDFFRSEVDEITIEDTPWGTSVTYGAGDSIFLTGVDASEISVDQFQFYIVI